MDTKKINDILEEIVLGKFLVNFVPGFILFSTFIGFINVGIGEGLTAFIIVTCFSWTLGALLELFCFRKSFNRSGTGETLTRDKNLYLLLGKMGMSMVIGCFFCIDIDWDAERNYRDLLEILRLVLFAIGGILFYVIYRFKINKMNREKSRIENTNG